MSPDCVTDMVNIARWWIAEPGSPVLPHFRPRVAAQVESAP
jgi:hypothetical protein